MRIIVQKFGGTSVATPESRQHCLYHIQNALSENFKAVVVVSAMGRLGDSYATDTLLSLLENKGGHLLPKDRDLLLATGELISSSVFSDLLHQNGITNTVLTGGQAGIITNEDFNEAKIIDLRPEKLLDALSQNDVVIVPGFQGITENGDITTLGRGGSDTTATALGVSIEAEYVDIFTDVIAVMTADPRVVKEALPIKEITYNEICNLAHLGAKVIHPRAVEMAMKKNIPVRIRSTFHDDFGTLVTNNKNSFEAKEKLITGITYNKNLTQFTINDFSKSGVSTIFEKIKEENISLDFINVQFKQVNFTVPTDKSDVIETLLINLKCEYTFESNCARVSVVGSNITGVPGIMYEIVHTLNTQNIDIYQSSDSHTTIWVLLKEDHVEKSVRLLHNHFTLKSFI